MPVENPNATFARLYPLSTPIDSAEAPELATADSNDDGKITMREARDRLIQQSRVLLDAESTQFKTDLEAFLLAKTGRAIDLTDASSTGGARVLYLQMNNAANKPLVEAADLKGMLAKDPDKPQLDLKNITAEFETEGDRAAATAAFQAAVRAAMDEYLARGQRMTGFIISGHSNGTDMLQETAEHMYYANLDVRDALAELREENGDYAALMDGCEKVGLLACFQGGALAEWAELFPNASLAGTKEFAPLSSSHASAAIYDAAATAHQVIEDARGSATDAFDAATRVPHAQTLKQRALAVHVPNSDADAAAQKQLTLARAAYQSVLSTINQVRASGKGGTHDMRELYTVANNYYLAMRTAWVLSGSPANEGAEIERLRFEASDLFAIRMGQTRPA